MSTADPQLVAAVAAALEDALPEIAVVIAERLAATSDVAATAQVPPDVSAIARRCYGTSSRRIPAGSAWTRPLGDWLGAQAASRLSAWMPLATPGFVDRRTGRVHEPWQRDLARAQEQAGAHL